MKGFVDSFKALADETRLRIVRLLTDGGKPLCVCEFVDALEVPQHNISRHLAVLKHAGLVTERKEGRWVYYDLAPTSSAFLRYLISAVKSIPDLLVAKDCRELSRRFKMREGGKCLKGIQKAGLSSR